MSSASQPSGRSSEVTDGRDHIVVVGGVAGGASTAARARRLCERCRITVYDKGPFVSFANCGLPYFVGDVIREEKDLIVASPELFRDRFDIDVKVRHEVVAIDRERRVVVVHDHESGNRFEEHYTKLVLSPGARALRPPLEGIDLPGIFVLRTIPDSRHIREWIERKSARRAVVVGAGFIGLEMAENLHARGLDVTILELADQVMPPLDSEMALWVQRHLESRHSESHPIQLRLGDGVQSFRETASGLQVTTAGGAELDADLVILAIGVRPENQLAKGCGLEVGELGGIRVDASMQTSDENIFAVGDAVEVRDYVTGEWTLAPLAGPANRQGRVAADAIFGRAMQFRGVQGTAVCGVFGLTVASSGASEKTLQRAGIDDYEKVYLHPGHHVGYYPGAKAIHLKLLFSKSDGRVLGVQAIGEAGVARRVDVVSMAIQKRMTVFDLEEAELCYAPQFGAAKDPVNLAGMIASNVLRGDHPLAHWCQLQALDRDRVTVVDVREPHEYDSAHVPGAINSPLTRLRRDIAELPRDHQLWLYCAVGQRAYYATRLLSQEGFDVRNLSGGFTSYQVLADDH